MYIQYEQVACNKMLILAALKQRNAEQLGHSGFNSHCCICYQTPGKSGLSGLVAVHAYPCAGVKEPNTTLCYFRYSKQMSFDCFCVVLKWVSNACFIFSPQSSWSCSK